MTDTGQVPGEGHPDDTGMVDQQGLPTAVPVPPAQAPAPGAPAGYAFQDLMDNPAEDEELLLMPSGQTGSWSDPQVVPPVPDFPAPADAGYADAPGGFPQPGFAQGGHPEAGYPDGGWADGAHEAGGRDSGALDLGGLLPPPNAQQPAPPDSPPKAPFADGALY
ncbi:hypothetical protein LG632_22635, partial [Streptomyces sp. SMC 277]|nr:hypothetical protein [Streptomyces antimicrobicus]